MERQKGQQRYCNIVIIGHCGTGKSTLVGKLIKLTNNISQETYKKYHTKAMSFGRGYHPQLLIADTLEQQTMRGITIDVHHNYIYHQSQQYHLINTPGHPSYVKNIIRGIVQADYTILVVAAPQNEFEMGIKEEGGRMLEYAFLSYMFGIKKLIVCVNKMSPFQVNYSQQQYKEVANQVRDKLKTIGYHPSNVTYVPIDSLSGANLLLKSDKTPWYQGPNLMQILSTLPIPKKQKEKPLRFVVDKSKRIRGVGTVLTGRVISGTLRAGMHLQCAHNKKYSEILTIQMDRRQVKIAESGSYVGINIKYIQYYYFERGDVFGQQNNKPPKAAESFFAQIIIFKHPKLIKVGYEPYIHCHSASMICKITNIEARIDKFTGKILENKPQSLKEGDTALVKLTPMKPLCVQVFQEYPSLGRFVMRDMNITVGVGVVKAVNTLLQKKQ